MFPSGALVQRAAQLDCLVCGCKLGCWVNPESVPMPCLTLGIYYRSNTVSPGFPSLACFCDDRNFVLLVNHDNTSDLYQANNMIISGVTW